MLISALCLSFMASLAKVLSANLPTIEIIFFRNFVGIILICLTFFKSPLKQSGGMPLLLIFRAIVGLIAMLSFFYNIANTSLANAVTYSRMSPIFTAIFALWFLKEKIGSKGWVAIALGFAGMLLVMQPHGLVFQKAHLFGFLNALCAALAFTSIRELKKYYDTRIIVLSLMGFGIIITFFLMILTPYLSSNFFSFVMGEFVMPSSIDWIYIIGIGITTSLGQVYMTKAYSVTKAGIVGATSYSLILFSLIIGLILGDNLPNLLGFLGILAIILSGILISR